jgi:hypothetical protein
MLDGLLIPQVSHYNLNTAGSEMFGSFRGGITSHSTGSESFVSEECIDNSRACVQSGIEFLCGHLNL